MDPQETVVSRPCSTSEQTAGACKRGGGILKSFEEPPEVGNSETGKEELGFYFG